MTYRCIAEIFLRSMKKYPLRPALIFQDQVWTYQKLGKIISAAILRIKKYLTTGDNRIAIIGDNHPSYVVAYFAAQFLGVPTVEAGRYESLDTLLNISETTKACFVVTDREDLKEALKQIVPVESFQGFLSTGEDNGNDASHLLKKIKYSDNSKEASIVYTSGTTGCAKGVILSQKNFCYIAHIVADYLKLSPQDRYALVLPLCHTYGKSILLSSFAAGSGVVMLHDFKNIPKLLKRLAENKATVLSVVPYHINIFLKGGDLSKYDLSSLRAITSSSNKLSPVTIDSLLAAFPNVQVFSMYGLTESTTRACYVPPDLLQTKKDSCGRPLPGVEIRIVGEDGTVLPTFHKGEVLLCGPNIMKGYFSNSKLTAETLVNGWLKTGDLGYLDNDGFLYLNGRKTDIIKCAGERISSLEIEAVLLEHNEVEEAAVIGRPDSLMGEIIHAYIVPGRASLNKSELRTYCLKRLSHQKVPYYYTFVDKLPKTGTGKVQKSLLVGMNP